MLLKRSISLLTPFPRTKVNLYHLIRHNFASSSKSFYQVLNVSQSASRNEIKTAYYKLAKLYHPDVSKGNEERFKEISSAYDTLSDDAKRKQYDDTLKYTSSSSNTSYSSSQQSSYGGNNSYNAYNNRQQQQQQQYQQQWNQNYQQRSHTNYEYDPEYDDPRYSQSYREQYTNQRSQQHQQYDPFSWDFRRRFYEDFESAQGKDYAAYEKAEEERMHQAEKEFEEALHQAMTDVRRKLITIIVACISLILLFKIAFGGRKRLVQEHVVYDQKNGALYVTDEKTYHQWVKSFQPDNYPFEKDPRFVRQNINFRQPTVPPYNPNYPNHPNQPRPVWDNNRVRDEKNGLAAVPPPPQNHQNPQNQQSQQ